MDEMTEAAETPQDEPAIDPQVEQKAALKKKNREISDRIRPEITKSIDKRRESADDWQLNIDRRLGRDSGPADTVDPSTESPINPDWAICITKEANLFSQVPAIVLTHEMKRFAAAIPILQRAVQYEIGIKRIDIGVPIQEGLADIVNAAGHAAVLTEFIARVKIVKEPDPLTGEVVEVPVPTDSKITCTRISPFKLIKPAGFTGSDFNKACLIGYEGDYTWSEAVSYLGLRESDKDNALSGEESNPQDTGNAERRDNEGVHGKMVKYRRVYYWRYLYDVDEPHFDCIWEIVYVRGIDDPVIHKPWEGQKYDPQSKKYIGNRRFPLQICTTTYVSDNPIVPSDTQIIRPQVNDQRRSRSQMFSARRHSIPLIWGNTSVLDPEILDIVLSGNWSGIVPVNGSGDHVFGQVARPSYPPESFEFDTMNAADMKEAVQLGPLQNGQLASGRHTADESNLAQSNFATLIGKQRTAVSRWFLHIIDNVIGWMILKSDWPNLEEQDKQTLFQTWDSGHITHDLALNVLPDSTIVLDSAAESNRQFAFANRYGKSGFVNPKPLVVRGAELAGMDPSELITDPQPPQEKPQISFRISSPQDLMNPLMMAVIEKAGYAPNIQELQQADQLVQAAAALKPPSSTPGPPPPVGGSVPPPAPSGPGLPPGAPQSALPPGLPPRGAPSGPPPMHPTHLQNWHMMPTIVKRERDAGSGGGGDS